MLKVEKTGERSITFSYVKFRKNCGFTGSMLGGNWGLVCALKHSVTNANLSPEFVVILVFINNQGSRTSVSKESLFFVHKIVAVYFSFFFLSKH